MSKMYEGPLDQYDRILSEIIDEVESFWEESQSQKVQEILTGLKMAYIALIVHRDNPGIKAKDILDHVLCFGLLVLEVAMEKSED